MFAILNLAFIAEDIATSVHSDIQMIHTVQESALEIDYIPANNPTAIDDYMTRTSASLQKSGEAILEDAKEDIL